MYLGICMQVWMYLGICMQVWMYLGICMLTSIVVGNLMQNFADRKIYSTRGDANQKPTLVFKWLWLPKTLSQEGIVSKTSYIIDTMDSNVE